MPGAVRAAGLIVAVQGAVALVAAVVLVVRALTGADRHVVSGSPASGWFPLGTAVLFVLIGGVVVAAGRALIAGRRWGRGLAVVTQLLLLPVAWYLVADSHRATIGVPAGVAALSVLVLLFTPPAVRWAARGGQAGPASSASRAPDSR